MGRCKKIKGEESTARISQCSKIKQVPNAKRIKAPHLMLETESELKRNGSLSAQNICRGHGKKENCTLNKRKISHIIQKTRKDELNKDPASTHIQNENTKILKKMEVKSSALSMPVISSPICTADSLNSGSSSSRQMPVRRSIRLMNKIRMSDKCPQNGISFSKTSKNTKKSAHLPPKRKCFKFYSSDGLHPTEQLFTCNSSEDEQVSFGPIKRKRRSAFADPNFDYSSKTTKKKKLSKTLYKRRAPKQKRSRKTTNCRNDKNTHRNINQRMKKNSSKNKKKLLDQNSHDYPETKFQFIPYQLHPNCQLLHNPANNTFMLGIPIDENFMPLSQNEPLLPATYNVQQTIPFNQFLYMSNTVSRPMIATNPATFVPEQNIQPAVTPSTPRLQPAGMQQNIPTILSTPNVQQELVQQNVPLITNTNVLSSAMQQTAPVYARQKFGQLCTSLPGSTPLQRTGTSMLVVSKKRTLHRVPISFTKEYVADPSLIIKFDWPLIMRRRTEIDADGVIEIAQKCNKYFDFSISQFCSDSTLIASFSKHHADFVENVVLTSSIRFNIDNISLDKPFIQVLKEFVHFYIGLMDIRLNKEYNVNYVKDAFFDSKFPVSFPILFNQLLKSDPKDITSDDLTSALTIGGILILFFEFRKRLQ